MSTASGYCKLLGRRPALALGGIQFANGARIIDGLGFPKSGTSGTGMKSGFGPPKGSIYIDVTNGVQFVNKGSSSSVYWTPVSPFQHGLQAFDTDFRDGQGKALSDTAGTATLTGSGVRVHGAGMVETDAGLTASLSDQGPVGILQVGADSLEAAVLSAGFGTTPAFKPNANGTMVVEAKIAQSVAITVRSVYLGWTGSAIDALASIVTGATTVLTPAATIGDDFAGLYFDSGMTQAAEWFAPFDKANTSATIAATGAVDTGVAVAAAGTFQTLRVEIDADGSVRFFIDKVLVRTGAAASLTVGTALQPVLMVTSLSAAVKIMNIKRFSAWGVKVTV